MSTATILEALNGEGKLSNDQWAAMYARLWKVADKDSAEIKRLQKHIDKLQLMLLSYAGSDNRFVPN